MYKKRELGLNDKTDDSVILIYVRLTQTKKKKKDLSILIQTKRNKFTF